MPPIQFIAKVAGTFAGADVNFAVPAATREGDVMIAIADLDGPGTIEYDNPVNLPWIASEILPWGAPVFQSSAGAMLQVVLTRIAHDTDGGTVTFEGDGTVIGGRAVLLVYRAMNLALEAEVDPYNYPHNGIVPLASGSTNVAASTNFPCPTLVATSYSDMYLGIVVVTSAAEVVTPPAGTTERHEENSGGRTLEVFDYFPEAAGATGTKVATVGVARNGIAIALLFAANGLPGPRVIEFPFPGAIGLPTEGV